MTATSSFTSAQQWACETPAICGIIVGFDGSPASHSAIETASVIATANRWPVHVVSVLPPMSSYRIRGNDATSETDKLRVQLREQAVSNAVSDINRDRWTHEVRIGKAADEIAKAADARAANLIILGRSQRRGVERLLVGETTTQVVRCSTAPVLLVDDVIEKPSTIVVGVDFRAASSRAAAVALRLLADSGTLYLVHVEEPVEVFPDGTTAPEFERYPGEVIGLFNRLVSSLKIENGVVVETIILNGSPISALSEFCDVVGADLLAVGSRRLTTMARVVLGSVSVGLARKTDVPLLIAPAL